MAKTVRLPKFQCTPVDIISLSEVIPWAFATLDIEKIHQRGYTGKGQKIAILDTGTDGDHPDLAGSVIAARSFISGESALHDKNGHGTWCHGIIGARANEDGIRGIAPGSGFLIGKVLSHTGWGGFRALVNAGDWAAENGATIISASLGSPRESKLVKDAVKAWTGAGIVFICAAGNSGKRGLGYPGRDPLSITVGAIDQTGKVGGFSSVGEGVDIVAPGVDILSTAPGGSYAMMTGTSMATPIVAGVIALIKAIGANKVYQDQKSIERLITETAKDIDLPGKDITSGYGIIDPMKAIKLVEDQKGRPITKAEAKKAFETLKAYFDHQ